MRLVCNKDQSQNLYLIPHEIVNIWTHLLGALVYSLGPLWFYSEISSRYDPAPRLDITALAIYFAGITVCFSLSTLYVNFLEAIQLRIFWH